jgi:hypothetical protein
LKPSLDLHLHPGIASVVATVASLEQVILELCKSSASQMESYVAVGHRIGGTLSKA